MNGEEYFGLLNLKIKQELDSHRRIVDAYNQKALENPLSLMEWELSAWGFARARLEVVETLYNYAKQLLGRWEQADPFRGAMREWNNGNEKPLRDLLNVGTDLLGKAAYGKPATPLERLERGKAVIVRDQAGYRVEDVYSFEEDDEPRRPYNEDE